MKHIKTFEGIFSNFRKDLDKRIKSTGLGIWQWGVDNKDENIGKFTVICGMNTLDSSIDIEELYRFLYSNIGKITMASKSGYGISYMVKYDNIPFSLQSWFSQSPIDHKPRYLVCMDQHFEFVGTYEECKIYLDAKKYNL
jgi:hypothetical protein